MKCNKNETCGNLLLNKNLKGKACRSYDGEVIHGRKFDRIGVLSKKTSSTKHKVSSLLCEHALKLLFAKRYVTIIRLCNVMSNYRWQV